MSEATSVADPRRERRKTDEKWRTALTCIEPNKILVRGYPLDEMMGRLTFGEVDLPAVHGRGAVAGDRPPDGSDPGVVHRPRRDAAVDAGGAQHGHDRRGDCAPASPRACSGSAAITAATSRAACSSSTPASRWCARARRTTRPPSGWSSRRAELDEPPPGFGHRFHTRDPRAARLFQMALELEVEAEHIQMIRAVEIVAERGLDRAQHCR